MPEIIANANSPYMGAFRMTQTQHSQHDGYDLVGLDSKEIHSTVDGTVIWAGWENKENHLQGFGQYVVVQAADKKMYHYGHLSEIKVSLGQYVKCTDVIGIEGSTGHSTGSHCHYCVRTSMSPGTALNLEEISGIPNRLGDYDDGFRPGASAPVPEQKDITVMKVEVKQGVNPNEVEAFIETATGKKYSGLLSEE